MVVSDVYEDEEDAVSEEEEVQPRVAPVKEDTIVVQKKAVSCILCMYVCMYVLRWIVSRLHLLRFLTENLTC